MTAITGLQLRPVSFKLRRPFITAGGRKTETHNIQVVIQLANGMHGYGEASTSIAMKAATPLAMTTALVALRPAVVGAAIDDDFTGEGLPAGLIRLIRFCWQKQGSHPTAVAALECALWDAFAKLRRRPLYHLLGGSRRSVVTDLTLSLGGAAALRTQAKVAARRGFRRLKIKLAGASPDANFRRIAAVHQAAPNAELLADGNQGMSLPQAIGLIERCQAAKLPLCYLEQPFPKGDLRSAKQFRERTGFPLLADESVLTAKDARRVFSAEAADAVNIKIAKSGISEALKIIAVARRFKKGFAIGCMEESKLGLAASVHLACGIGDFCWIDLDSVLLLEASSLRGGFLIDRTSLFVQARAPGIGIA